MTTARKIQLLMDRTGMRSSLLAVNMDLRSNVLAAVLMGSVESNQYINDKVNKFTEKIGVCPECITALVHTGGCVQCVCGYERCG